MNQWSDSLQRLQQVIGYTFRQPELLETALTHSSFVKGDGASAAHNERLEFLATPFGAYRQRTIVFRSSR